MYFYKQPELRNLKKLRSIMLKIAEIVDLERMKLYVRSVHEIC